MEPAKSIFDVKAARGGIFIDNLMVCSADRLLSTHYRPFENERELNHPDTFGTLFSCDLLNLAALVESIVCHKSIYINSEYIDRWNSNIEQSALQPLTEIVVPITWTEAERREAEGRLSKNLPAINDHLGLSRLAAQIFRFSHHPFDQATSFTRRKFFLPYDEGSRPWGTPFYIAIGTAFYLMSSQILGIPYKPSVIRAKLLSELFEREFQSRHHNAADIAIALLEKSREQVANDYFSKLLEFNIIDVHLPCVLSAVLREAESTNEVLTIAKQMRDSSQAKSFRDWCENFTDTIQNGDLAAIGKFTKELEGVIDHVNKFLGLKTGDTLNVKLGWGPASLSHSFSLPKVLERPIYFKRHLWFLHNMYSNIASMARLSDRIQRVLIESLPERLQSLIDGKINWSSIQSLSRNGY